MKKILVIEDCLQTQLLLKKILARHEVKVECVSTAAEARASANAAFPDMILLDLSLPDEDGFQFFSEIRAASSEIPVIFITGKQEVAIKVAAFSLGAEDYIVKPFEVTELTARLDAQVKKLLRQKSNKNIFKIGQLQIDLGRQQAFDVQNQKAIKLTGREFKLLVFLAKNENNILSREQLLDAVWGNASSVFDRTIDTHISAIRKKLGPLSSYIESVKGSGYRLSPASVKAAA